MLQQAGEGGGGSGDGQQQQQQQQQQSGFWNKYDDHLPDGLKGAKSAEDALDRMFNGWKGLRDTTAKFAAPKDATGYEFTPGDKIKPYFSNAEKDNAILDIARTTAHKLGMPGQMFGTFINDVFGGMQEKGMLPAVYSPEAQANKLGELMFKDMSGAERMEAVKRATTDAAAFAPTLADQLKLSPEAKAELVGMADFAGGIQALHAIKAALAEKGLQINGQPNNQGYSADDYDKDVKDERYQPFSPKYDPKFRAAVDEKAKQLFGSGPAAG